MRSLTLPALVALAVLSVAGCDQVGTPSVESSGAPAAEQAGVDAASSATIAAQDAGFDVSQVPISTVTLPPFPLFDHPEGLASDFTEADSSRGFARVNFIAGDRIVPIEGEVFHTGYALSGPDGRRYSELEFLRNYQNAITGLGGVRISTVQFTDAVVAAAGGREAVEEYYLGGCVAPDCTVESYLIRNGGQEYWINVAAGGVIPPHGYVTVLRREAMTQSVGYLSAEEMLAAINANGRVALDINFDFDRATLRPEGDRVVAEIVRLMNANRSLNLSIEGHTDNVGTAERNRTLSGERAETVRAALVAQGIAASRLTARGFGPDRPVASNDTDEGRARNRRVELVRVS